MINSNTATVKEIKGDKVSFDLGNGKIRSFDKNDPAIRHIDYAYAVTAHSAQGKTTDNVIAVAKSSERFLTNQQTFYVEISRAKESAVFIVDDKQKVADQLTDATGEKISAMENQGLKYLGESPFDKVDKELEKIQHDYEKEQELNKIDRVDEDKRPKALEKESGFDKSFEELSKEFLANNKLELSEKGKEIIENAKNNKPTVDYSKYNFELETRSPKTDDDIFSFMKTPKYTQEEIEANRARVFELLENNKQSQNENNNENSSSSTGSKGFEFDL